MFRLPVPEGTDVAPSILTARVSTLMRASRQTRGFARQILHGFAAIAICTGALASDPTELQKPAPDARVQPFRERLTVLVKEQYPQLLAGSLVGTPVITVLFNPDGTVARSDLQVLAQIPNTLTASEAQFQRLGLGRAGELQYVGEARVQLPHSTVFVIFGARSSEALDRELVERYFPDVFKSGVKSGESLWILFDHQGHALKRGAEVLQTADLKKLMETRYPGIRISDATVAPVIGADGRPVENSQHEALRLNSLWLAADSPAPPT
jgi:hypothetical protein